MISRCFGLVALVMGASVVGAFGCAADESSEGDPGSSEDMLVSSNPLPFDVGAMTPRAKKTFAAPNGATELCVIAKHFSEEGYSEKDKKKEEKLCKIDFNGAVGAEGTIAAGLAPKANSTNPATDVHEVTAEVSREEVESFAEANARDRKGKKLGRVKSSLDASRYDRTSSYAPSIVGYYETSRMLGHVGEVTPAVWRTMDVKHHAKVAENGKRLTVVGSQIVKTLWSSFLSVDTGSAPKGNLTYTSDGNQLYGAFIPSVSGDEKDKDIDTLPKLQASARFKRLTDGRPMATQIGRDFKTAVETIVPMQGVVEMLILDALMLQGDRLSGDNVSYVPFMFFQKADGSVDRISKDDLDELQAEHPDQVPQGAIAVRKLYLNDVDAGLIVRNADSFQQGSEYQQLKKMQHISPDLYAKVKKLAALTSDSAFETFVKAEWRYTDRDWVRYKAMTEAVAALLKERCNSGALVLDLDIQKHVAGTNLGARQGCE